MIKYDLKQANTIGEAFTQLYEIITHLRSPEGCPWDRIQTEETTIACLIDEAYEYLDASVKKDIDNMREEIGDVLLNSFLILRIHDEKNDFTPLHSINELCEKLIRRHPHVFGDVEVKSSEDALSSWNSVKENVEGKKKDINSLINKVPKNIPELERSSEVLKAVSKSKLDCHEDSESLFEKIMEEFNEVKEAVVENDKDHIEEELGDFLYMAINLCKHYNVKPNIALRKANNKVLGRLAIMNDLMKERGLESAPEAISEKGQLWYDAKMIERSALKNGK